MAGIDNDVRTYQDAYASGSQIPLSPSLVQLLALQRNEAAKKAGMNQQQLQQQPMPGTILQQKQQAQYAQQSPQDVAQRIGPTMQRQAAQEQQMPPPQQAPQGGQGLAGIQPQQFRAGGQVKDVPGDANSEDFKGISEEQVIEAVRNAKARGKSLDETLVDIDKLLSTGGALTGRAAPAIKAKVKQAWGPEGATPQPNQLDPALIAAGQQATGMPNNVLEGLLSSEGVPDESIESIIGLGAPAPQPQAQPAPQPQAQPAPQPQAQPTAPQPQAQPAVIDPQQAQIDALLGMGAETQEPSAPPTKGSQAQIDALLGMDAKAQPQAQPAPQPQAQPTLEMPEAMFEETKAPVEATGGEGITSVRRAQQAQPTLEMPEAMFEETKAPVEGTGGEGITSVRPLVDTSNPFAGQFATPEQMQRVRDAGYQGRRETLSTREWGREMNRLGAPTDLTPDGFTGAATKAPVDGVITALAEEPVAEETPAVATADSDIEELIGGGPSSSSSKTVSASGTDFDRVMPTAEFTSLVENVEDAKALKKAMGLPEKATKEEIKAAQEAARKLYKGELGNTETRKMLVKTMDNVQRIYDRSAARNDNSWNHISAFLRGMSGGTTIGSGMAMGSASMANNIDRLSNAEAKAAKELFDVTKELYASDTRIAEGAFNYADTVLRRMEAQNQAIDQTDSARLNQVIQLNAQQDNTRNTEAWNKYTAEREIWAANLKHTTDMAITSMKNQADALTSYVTNAAKLADVTKLSVETQDLIMERLPTIVSPEVLKAARSDDTATAAAAQQIVVSAVKEEMDKTGLTESMRAIATIQKILGEQIGLAPEEPVEAQTFTKGEIDASQSFLDRVMDKVKG